MKYLLDTHVFLWAITADSRLSKRQKAAYLNESSVLYLSVASVWEVLIKAGLGKLAAPQPVAEYLARQIQLNRIELLPIRMSHLAELENLPPLHRDPFDRMLVAQARAEGLRLLTGDRALKRYGVDVG